MHCKIVDVINKGYFKNAHSFTKPSHLCLIVKLLSVIKTKINALRVDIDNYFIVECDLMLLFHQTYVKV